MELINKNQDGFTLMEIIVAVSIFVVVVFSATNIFLSVNNVQRYTIANQANQDSVRYFMEVISKEIRQAKNYDPTACDPIYNNPAYDLENKVFRTTNSQEELFFTNKYDECVRYYLNSYNDIGVIVREIGGVKASSTPVKLVADNLSFSVDDNRAGEAVMIQPKVTLSFDIKYASSRSEYEQPLRMQTTVSSRNYRGN